MQKANRIILCTLLLLGGLYTRARAGAVIEQATGIVEVQGHRISRWEPLARTPYPLRAGDRLRTGTRASARIRFSDGSKVHIGSDATVGLEEASPKRIALQLALGELTADVVKLLTRRFEVRTPVALAAVRGTEFRVKVFSGGRTDIHLLSGLLGVEDNRGRQVLLHPSESLRIDRRGMGVPQRTLSSVAQSRGQARGWLRREIHFDQRKSQTLAAMAREAKLEEFQQGKVLVDVNGNRVRVEHYLMRPRSDQFKWVVLNARADRFDYFYYLGTFNKSLPGDLTAALRQLGGGLDTAPEYFLTAFETGRSNTVDTIREVGVDGHLVDVNTNADATDDVSRFFDASLGRFVDVAGRSVFKPIFDDYGFYLNGKLKFGWTGTNLQSANDAIAASNLDPISGAVLTAANAYFDGTNSLAVRTVNTTFPDVGQVRQRKSESYSDGSTLIFDSSSLNSEGGTVSSGDFPGLSGTAYQEGLLKFNYQQIISASEFAGRKIDLVIAPQILLQTGRLP
jgi:hypothetical protein